MAEIFCDMDSDQNLSNIVSSKGGYEEYEKENFGSRTDCFHDPVRLQLK